VIQSVGPVWSGGKRGEPELLRRCYLRSLGLAAERDVRSIAFPATSTAAYGYPIERAAAIAVAAVRERANHATSLELVRFECFSAADLAVSRRLLGA
jgi:O-acetyl-ADP-ribose deacetylase (regulator of RNase III)